MQDLYHQRCRGAASRSSIVCRTSGRGHGCTMLLGEDMMAQIVTMGFKFTWGFPKIGHPNIVPEIVGSRKIRTPKERYPLFLETPTCSRSSGQPLWVTVPACPPSLVKDGFAQGSNLRASLRFGAGCFPVVLPLRRRPLCSRPFSGG